MREISIFCRIVIFCDYINRNFLHKFNLNDNKGNVVIGKNEKRSRLIIQLKNAEYTDFNNKQK